MNDLISRQAAIEAVDECTKLKITDDFYTVYTEDMKYMIADIPAADVVEVVRCKDCMKYNTDDCMMIHGKKMNRNIFANDYCSYAERADE